MMKRVDLITEPYCEMQRELHAKPQGYGGKGYKWIPTVAALLTRFDAWSVLDYGCGKGSLTERMKRDRVFSAIRFSDYDPAIEGKNHMPGFADLVICTDVLEHIEIDRLDNVLGHLRQLARKAVFVVVALDEANKILSDGRNAHLILESPEWWQDRVRAIGFTTEPMDGLPLPFKRQEKRDKRWIAVLRP